MKTVAKKSIKKTIKKTTKQKVNPKHEKLFKLFGKPKPLSQEELDKKEKLNFPFTAEELREKAWSRK